MKFSGVTILQEVEFSIFPIDFEWALQQCSATALPVIMSLDTSQSLSAVIYRAYSIALLCINQHTKFEVPSFTVSKDMIGTKFLKKTSHDPEHALSGWFVILKLGYDRVCLCTKLDDSSFSRSRDIIGGPKI